MPDVLRIADAEPLGGHVLRLTFSTGEERVVDVGPLVERVGGPVFAPLRDPSYFGRVSVDPTCGTVVWPNGADVAPTALYDLEDAIPGAGGSITRLCNPMKGVSAFGSSERRRYFRLVPQSRPQPFAVDRASVYRHSNCGVLPLLDESPRRAQVGSG